MLFSVEQGYSIRHMTWPALSGAIMPYFVTQSLKSEAFHDENHTLWSSIDPNSALIREIVVGQAGR